MVTRSEASVATTDSCASFLASAERLFETGTMKAIERYRFVMQSMPSER